MKKLCLFCKHFYFEYGERDWSKYTPGHDAKMGCSKNIMTIDLFDDTLQEYRRKILMAKTCLHYEQINIEDDEGID